MKTLEEIAEDQYFKNWIDDSWPNYVGYLLKLKNFNLIANRENDAKAGLYCLTKVHSIIDSASDPSGKHPEWYKDKHNNLTLIELKKLVDTIKNEEKIRLLENKLEETRLVNRSVWDIYGSELCAGEMLKEEEKIEEKIQKLRSTVNYMQVEDNSHFWTNLDMLIHYLENMEILIDYTDKKALIEYLKIGLNNTKKQGYDLVKLTDI